MATMKDLHDERANAVAKARAILDRADAEKRPLSAEEKTEYERWDADVDHLNDRIEKQRLNPPRSAAPVRPEAKANPNEFSLNYTGNKTVKLSAGSPELARSSEQYASNFRRYLSSGGVQKLGLQVGKDNKGGYLAPMQFVANLIKFLDNNVFMRQLATVLPPAPTAVNIGVPTWDTDPGDADWSAEVPASDISEDDTARVGSREFMPHLLTKLVKVSRKLMRTATIDPMGLLNDRLGYKFAVTEEQAYMTGDGAQQPLGVFVASVNGVTTARDVTSGVTAGTSFNADDLINLLYSLKEGYQKNATGLFHRDAIKMARKLKDGNGQYLWQPGLQGQPNTLLDRPVVMSEYAPNTFTTGLYVGMFADFKAGYWIQDSLEMEIEDVSVLFSLKNQAGIIGRKETDGAPVLAEAFARLKLA